MNNRTLQGALARPLYEKMIACLSLPQFEYLLNPPEATSEPVMKCRAKHALIVSQNSKVHHLATQIIQIYNMDALQLNNEYRRIHGELVGE